MTSFYTLSSTLKKTAILLFVLLLKHTAIAQTFTQTIRGIIIDKDVQTPLIGANIVVLANGDKLGATSIIDGSFRINDVPLGRVNIYVSYIGYEDKKLSNLLVKSGKELVLKIGLKESVNKLEEIVVTDKTHKSETLNEMAIVSARSFSVEETQRYAGAIDDPARMVASFAGVNGDAQGDNDIVVRGNSSKGILWRLEGVEIPNPNHFANDGATGGPINALNSNMLANSDFSSGAFAPEYGNALSGVFDMNLRTGNNEKREYSASASVLGLDLTVEGPFSKNYKGSYVANYRYSSLAIIDDLGILDFGGVPKYQDASFKIELPVNKKHKLSLFGLGGFSSIAQTSYEGEEDEVLISDSEFNAELGFAGISHIYAINPKTFLKNIASVSATSSGSIFNIPDENKELYNVFNENFTRTFYKFSSDLNYKFNARNKVKAGFIYTRLGYNMKANNWDFDIDQLSTTLDIEGQSSMIQAFLNWKYRINEDLDLVSGLHYLHFTLNQNYSIEPRAALQWRYKPRHIFSLGMGIHSKMESISIYMIEFRNNNGEYINPNRNLEFSKAAHFVAGYDFLFNSFTHLKAEAYYQHLYDALVEDDPNSSFSLLNYNSGYISTPLVNNGAGKNYGLELTLEQYLHRGLYYMSTLSLYKSRYTANDGIERNSAYDGNYVFNMLGGKEFKIGESKKNRMFFVDLKLALIGGQRYTPINLESSIEEGYQIRRDDVPFSVKGDDVFKLDVSLGIRRNRKKTSSELKLSILNVTNNKAVVNEYYQDATQSIIQGKQLPLFPVISYKINF